MIRKTSIALCGNCIRYEGCYMKAFCITMSFGGRQFQTFEFVKVYWLKLAGNFRFEFLLKINAKKI